MFLAEHASAIIFTYKCERSFLYDKKMFKIFSESCIRLGLVEKTKTLQLLWDKEFHVGVRISPHGEGAEWSSAD